MKKILSTKKLATLLSVILVISVLIVTAVSVSAASTLPTLKSGSSGTNVYALQYLLVNKAYSVSVDGQFGSGTQSAVKSFQKSNGLTADGIVGTNTWNKLFVTVKSGSNNNAVKAVQKALSGKGYPLTVDGAFGPDTKDAVVNFQSKSKITADGIVGDTTWSYLLGTSSVGGDNKSKKIKSGGTAHFNVSEFKCSCCGSVGDGISVDLLNKLEQLRTKLGNKSITINSGYRCPKHNAEVDGAKDSQHMHGTAADIRVSGLSPSAVANAAESIFANGGLGRYPTFTHVDVRGYKSRW